MSMQSINLLASGLSLPGLIHSNYSVFNPFGNFKSFVLDAANRFAESSKQLPASVELGPSGTFSYERQNPSNHVERSLFGLNFYVSDYVAQKRSDQEWLTKVEEKVAYRAYSSAAQPTTYRSEEVLAAARLPDAVRSGNIRIEASQSDKNVELNVVQDAGGNTVVVVGDPDSEKSESINFGAVARLEIETIGGSDNISVNGSRFVGGIDVQSGEGADVVNINGSMLFGSGVVVDGGGGADSIRVVVDNANLSLSGGDGDDVLDVAEMNLSSWYGLSVYGGAGDDTISGSKWVDRVWGGDGNDSISLGAGRDYAYGQAGNDYIDGGVGDDDIDGGANFDVLDGGQRYTYKFLNYSGLSDNDYIHGQGGDDDIVGGAGMDVLLGGDGADRLYGNTGSDTLVGGVGDDRMFGGAHGDFLQGDAGADLFAPKLTDEQDTEDEDGYANIIRDFDASQGDVII